MDLKKYNFNEKLFYKLRDDYLKGKFNLEHNKIKEKISAPESNMFKKLHAVNQEEYKKLKICGEDSLKNGEAALVIVNGGMATRFGSLVKGIVEVINNMSFLQLKLEDVKFNNKKYNIQIPVFIMNSFATETATLEHLKENDYFGLKKESIYCFNQFISKRIFKDGQIFEDEDNPLLTYYAPGHGDFIYAFKERSCYDFAKQNKIKYLLFSNVDNLGAVIEPAIIGSHILSGYDITVELAEKIKGDKGGLPLVVNNNLQIVEDFKIPDTFDKDSVQSFNTATYVFNLSIFEKDIILPWYVVEKKVNEHKILQFEHLTGDLTQFFNCNFLIVDRKKRFYPIKTVENLENARDKIFELYKDKIG